MRTRRVIFTFTDKSLDTSLKPQYITINPVLMSQVACFIIVNASVRLVSRDYNLYCSGDAKAVATAAFASGAMIASMMLLI